MNKIEIGSAVVYVDPVGQERPAVVTNTFGDENCPSVNVVFVCKDATMTDNYGRQIGRQTSVTHQSKQGAPGNYWKAPSA